MLRRRRSCVPFVPRYEARHPDPHGIVIDPVCPPDHQIVRGAEPEREAEAGRQVVPVRAPELTAREARSVGHGDRNRPVEEAADGAGGFLGSEEDLAGDRIEVVKNVAQVAGRRLVLVAHPSCSVNRRLSLKSSCAKRPHDHCRRYSGEEGKVRCDCCGSPSRKSA